MSTQGPTNKSELQQHLHQSWAELQQALDSFSDEQLTTLKDQVGWTIKDHLAHLIPWEQGIVAMLKRQPRYEAMGLDSEMIRTQSEDELNQLMRSRYEPRSLSDVRDSMRRTHEALLATIDALSDADLLKTYSYYQPQEPGEDSGQAILRWVVGNSSGHYREHLPWIQAIAAQR